MFILAYRIAFFHKKKKKYKISVNQKLKTRQIKNKNNLNLNITKNVISKYLRDPNLIASGPGGI